MIYVAALLAAERTLQKAAAPGGVLAIKARSDASGPPTRPTPFAVDLWERKRGAM